ncbi:hypothetical protein [Wenxinia saemankumensis]|uniref:Uncharacterized protein n=1 Tax=Wenxinia saemankumensis TaxID=1447782 RepID=A0A1M6GKE9_9RHOB|nr:hypothetical protein [Wenxinia saemankumensis]SHJ10417.1 hypothetical protein SAMN05444417_2786 [Wenxinia saemankumensis]
MPRRSSRPDLDLNFPVRVKIRVPPTGLGQRLVEAIQWLRRELPDRHGHGSARMLRGDAIALHFVSLEDAAHFVAAFPDFELAV